MCATAVRPGTRWKTPQRPARCATRAWARCRVPPIRWCRPSTGSRNAGSHVSRSPYVDEIAMIAEALDFSGVWLLNASMQWGCTSRASTHDGLPWLLRTLDWPFRGLGHHTELAHMSGAAGDFISVTWPGYVGVLTALAPGRFAAALNQAPMWRRTEHAWLRPCDFALNAVRVWSGDSRMPPDQLLAFKEILLEMSAAGIDRPDKSMLRSGGRRVPAP